MNFLAHLLTGDSGPSILVGSFAGDFCRGRIEGHHPDLRPGIRLHRMVDSFAEEHPSFSGVRARLRPALGLYAPVGADMLIDHVLAMKWNEWVGGETLEEFANRAGAVLLDSDLLPEHGARVARWMVEGRWLQSYATREGVRTALDRMSRRTRRGFRLAEAMQHFEQNRDVMSWNIMKFLNDLFTSPELLEAGMADYLDPAEGLAGAEPRES
ncbi:MAG: ACP phosphodiesterase [Thermoanaerobaculia bacterium]|nr:ACP phosphodiesterase [Thermoanaerobaculia bacterium]